MSSRRQKRERKLREREKRREEHDRRVLARPEPCGYCGEPATQYVKFSCGAMFKVCDKCIRVLDAGGDPQVGVEEEEVGT
jgi:hypothetical protein